MLVAFCDAEVKFLNINRAVLVVCDAIVRMYVFDTIEWMKS